MLGYSNMSDSWLTLEKRWPGLSLESEGLIFHPLCVCQSLHLPKLSVETAELRERVCVSAWWLCPQKCGPPLPPTFLLRENQPNRLKPDRP